MQKLKFPSFYLRFKDSKLEEEFRQYYNIKYIRLSLLLGALIYSFFFLIDPILTPDIYPLAWLIKGVLLLFLFFPIFILSFSDYFKNWLPYLVSFIVFVVGFSIIYITNMSIDHKAHLHFIGLILVFIYSYTFSRILVDYVNISVLAIWGVYLAGLFYNPHLDIEYIIIDVSFLIFSLICSVYAGFLIEKLDRNNFLLLRDLDKQKKELELANKKLEKSSFVDYLTGLYNRRYMEMRFREAIATYKRHKISTSIMFFDLDDFKKINDEYGHDFGDLVLKEIGKVMRSYLRDNDVIFRYGGDEFCVLLLNSDLFKSLEVGKRMLRGLKELTNIAGKEVKLSFSGGCISLFPDIDSVSEIIKRADNLLYKAKMEGKGRILGDFSGVESGRQDSQK